MWRLGHPGLDSPSSGITAQEYPADVAFPAGLTDGSRGEVVVNRPGMPDLILVLPFVVNEQV